MTPNRPYLIRALYDWLVDNGMTPHLLVDANSEGVVVPTQFVQEGRIVLNISPTAVQRLNLGNDLISFSARFEGAPWQVSFPPHAVVGIYARENGRGMLFPEEGPDEPAPPEGPKTTPDRPSLRVIK